MSPTLTLHQGDAVVEFEEHPTELARKALIRAAEVETGRWPELLREAARQLPHRSLIQKADD